MTDKDNGVCGIFLDRKRPDYEAIKGAVNYSTLKHFARTPAHARQEIVSPREATPAMELGTAVHMAILEPERFAKEYVQAPACDRRTTAGKTTWTEFMTAHPGRNYLTAQEWDQCHGIMQSVSQHELAPELFYGKGANEVTCVWRDEESGLLCKSRLDRFTTLGGWSMVVDVKTTEDASPWAFTRIAARLQYHVQAAFYLDGLRAQADRDRRFIIVAVEKNPPYCLIIYEFDDAAIELGRRRYRKYIQQYAECMKTNVWPGYPSGIYPLSLPSWAEGANDYEP